LASSSPVLAEIEDEDPFQRGLYFQEHPSMMTKAQGYPVFDPSSCHIVGTPNFVIYHQLPLVARDFWITGNYNLASLLRSSFDRSSAPMAERASPPCIQKLLNPRTAYVQSSQLGRENLSRRR
jgi:hypothetical protein